MGLYNDITFTTSHVTPHAVKTATDLIGLYELHRDPALAVDIAPLLADFDLRFLDLPPATWGFTLDMERKIIIALNSNLTPDQTRFTAMHEIGHVALWHPNQLNMCITDPHAYTLLEAEATTVAAMLLVPQIAAEGSVIGMVEVLAVHYRVPPSLVFIRRSIYRTLGV